MTPILQKNMQLTCIPSTTRIDVLGGQNKAKWKTIPPKISIGEGNNRVTVYSSPIIATVTDCEILLGVPTMKKMGITLFLNMDLILWVHIVTKQDKRSTKNGANIFKIKFKNFYKNHKSKKTQKLGMRSRFYTRGPRSAS